MGGLLGHPGLIFQAVDYGSFPRMLVMNILLPLLFLPLFSSFGLLLIPPLAVMFLSKITQMYTFGIYYSALFLPFLFLALIYGLKNATHIWSSRIPGKRGPEFSS